MVESCVVVVCERTTERDVGQALVHKGVRHAHITMTVVRRA